MDRTPDSARRAASRRLHAMDSAAEFVVTIGGFVVLSAVLGICLYLAWVVVPLFVGGSNELAVQNEMESASPLELVVDPYGQAAGIIGIDGVYRSLLIPTGEIAGEDDLAADAGAPTAISVNRNGQLVAAGYADGSVRLGEVGFESELIAFDESAPEFQSIESGYIKRLEDGQRRVVVTEELGDPVTLKAGAGAVIALDYRVDPTGKKALIALREDGTVAVNSVRTIRPLGGGAPRTRLRTNSFAMDDPDDLPKWLFVTGDGDFVFAIWESGRLERYLTSGSGEGALEIVELVEPGTTITDVTMLLGAKTLLVGDSDGSISAFHVADDPRRDFRDGMRVVRAHLIKSSDGSVIDMAPSVRDRTIAVLHDNGYVRVLYETSEKRITRFKPEIEGASRVAITPKNDGVIVFGSDGSYQMNSIELGYPEFSTKAVFGKVFYEGGTEPEYVYQSSSGDDASEVKLSLMPLIFGTLKATIFAMIFAIPVAVLAAMYSSEFLSQRVRRVVKPSVELMASLPSVVLGFIAAIVVAPYMQKHLPVFVIGIMVVPLTVIVAAHLWQLVPIAHRRRLRSGHHFTLLLLTLVLGALFSSWVGPMIVRGWFAPSAFDASLIAGSYEPVPAEQLPSWADDRVLTERETRRLRPNGFALVDGVVVRPVGEVDTQAVLEQSGLEDGSLQRWLNDEYGSAWPGWAIAIFPLSSIVIWLLQGLLLRRQMDAWLMDKSAVYTGAVVLAKLAVLCVLSLLVSVMIARVLGVMGFDPRDSIFGTFSPRNTLVVAIIMGFAVIPIIYTISEDSLQAVPKTLRSASLGAGATPWQTAVRVVLPVAGSGIFSACMIGFGRAVGETMIVLMATGNTPEMSWNIFSGFRTLAANIAVEIPEAPKDQTHYRVLFLCGLVLFLMTFVINTLAEIIRRVVRARNAGL